jgi:hypothetical protein
MHLHLLINTSIEAEPSHSTATSNQAIAGAPHQPLPQPPSPIRALAGTDEPDHVQINNWDDEAEEEATSAEEEELVRVQQEIERLQQKQESILRRQTTMQRAETHRQNIIRERASEARRDGVQLGYSPPVRA